MKIFAICLLLAAPAAALRAATADEIARFVSAGHWQQARQEIAAELASTNLAFPVREDLLFQQDRMARMRLDFNRTRGEVLAAARAAVPAISDAQFAAWENAGALEFLEVDGTRWYYHGAAANLFRINPEARELMDQAQPDTNSLYRLEDIRNVIARGRQTGQPLNSPHAWRITYTLTVKPDSVPAGETIRAWLPLPHPAGRQHDLRVVATDPPQHVRSDPNAALASVYLEKPSAGHAPTSFTEVFELTTEAFYQAIDPARVQPADPRDPALAPFLGEQPPHLVFSDPIKALSRKIIGGETNSYLKARRLFEWTFRQLPWTAAREYSTIECLPAYALAGGHGDCGIKTMTFMTLCRLNGIPARWESGWTMAPPPPDMHDWCEIYLAPYGWIPADVTYGVVDSPDEAEKWFYLGGIDALRFFANTDHTQPLYPAKTHYRSEIIDFQRGEVEWRGGNLYFNQWNYDFKARERKEQ